MDAHPSRENWNYDDLEELGTLPNSRKSTQLTPWGPPDLEVVVTSPFSHNMQFACPGGQKVVIRSYRFNPPADFKYATT